MASEKSLSMRFDKASLSDSPIYPSRPVTASNGTKFFVCKSLDGEYYASKVLGGQVVNITRVFEKANPEMRKEAIAAALAEQLGDTSA